MWEIEKKNLFKLMKDSMKSWAKGERRCKQTGRRGKTETMYLAWGIKRRREIKQIVCGRGENTAKIRKLLV